MSEFFFGSPATVLGASSLDLSRPYSMGMGTLITLEFDSPDDVSGHYVLFHHIDRSDAELFSLRRVSLACVFEGPVPFP